MNFALLFEIQIGVTLAIFWKICKTTLFRKPTEVKIGLQTCYFLIFTFSFFQILNDYCQKSYNRFRVLLGSSTRHKYFWSTQFDKGTATLFNLFKICTEMHFVSLFFLNERNITTSLLMIHLKCTVVHYANLNSSSINKPFLNYGLLNMLFRFFLISYLCLF